MNIHNLSVLSYVNGFTLWHYLDKQDLYTAQLDFSCAWDMLHKGDTIYIQNNQKVYQVYVSLVAKNRVLVQEM